MQMQPILVYGVSVQLPKGTIQVYSGLSDTKKGARTIDEIKQLSSRSSKRGIETWLH